MVDDRVIDSAEIDMDWLKKIERYRESETQRENTETRRSEEVSGKVRMKERT